MQEKSLIILGIYLRLLKGKKHKKILVLWMFYITVKEPPSFACSPEPPSFTRSVEYFRLMVYNFIE